MTNSVKKIEEKVSFIAKCTTHTDHEPNNDFMFYVYNKRIEEAKYFLQKNMWDHYAMRNMVNAETLTDFDDAYRILKQDYEYMFSLINEEFPTFEHIRERINEQ